MRRAVITALSLLTLAGNAHALDLSFEQAREMALTNSKMLKAYEAEAEASQYRFQQARGAFLPKVTLSETYMQTDEPGNAAFSTMRQGKFDMGYFTTQLANPDAVTNYTTKLEIVQPIFTGGQIYYSVKQAEKAMNASSLTRDRVRQAVLFNLSRAYFGVALADKAYDVVKSSYARTGQYVTTARNFLNNGMVVKSDVLTAETHLLMNEDALRDAEKQRAVACSQLQRLVDADEIIHVQWADPGYQTGETLDKYIELALANRPDLRAMEKYAEAKGFEYRKAAGSMLPEVALFADYQQNGESLMSDDGKGTTVGVMVKVNLFEGGSGIARMKEAKTGHYAFMQQIADKRQEIKTEVREAYFGLEAAMSRVETAKKRIETAKESLNITEKRFAEGLAKITDLLDREVDLKQAMLSLAFAEYETIVQKAALLFAAGILDDTVEVRK